MTESTNSESSPSTTPSTTPGIADGPSFTGARRTGFVLIPPLAMLFLALGVVQIFLAGYGVFDLNGVQLGAEGETAFGPHRFVGMLMMIAALLLLVAALVARPGRRIVILAVTLLVIVTVLESVLASAGEDTPLLGGLHALFGIGSLGVASSILAGARAKPRAAGAAT